MVVNVGTVKLYGFDLVVVSNGELRADVVEEDDPGVAFVDFEVVVVELIAVSAV